MDEEPKANGSVIERHAQTIIVAVLLGLLLWSGSTLLDIRTDVTTLKVQVGTLQGEIRAGTDDRFRGSDWRREKEAVDLRFRHIEDDILRLEAEIEKRHKAK